MITVTKLQKLKNILRKASATLLVIGLLTTTYGGYLQSNVLSAQQETVQSLLRIDNLSFPEVNTSPYYSNTSSMGVPKQVIRLYQFYGNKTSEAMQNVEIILQAPVSSSSRAALFPTTVAPASTDALVISYSNNNGQTWDYSPSGAVDRNVTHVRWVAQNIPANTLNQSVQAQFQAPEQATNTQGVYTSQGSVMGNGVKINSNSVSFRNMTKPEFNKMTPGETEHTLKGTNDITSIPTPYEENVPLQMGQEFGARVYIRNVIPETEANNVKIRLEFPTIYATTHTVKAYLSAANAETLIDTTVFTTARPAKLRYLKNSDLPGRNSCKLTWHGQHQYKLCGDEIATTGYVWTDGPLKYGSAETLQLTVEAMVDEQPQATPTPTATPTQTPAVTPTPSPTPTVTPSPSPTQTPRITPTPTPRVTPTPTPSVTPSPTPRISPTPTVSPTPTATPTATPAPSLSPSPTPAQITQLKLCKYEDDDANGVHNNGENVLSWTFNYTANGQNNTVNSHWWHTWTQGCAIINVPSNAQISVSEAPKSGWRLTGVYADGARADSGTPVGNFTYNYTSNVDDVKVLWFLNTFTPVPQPTQTPAPTSTATPSPTGTPAPTATPTNAPSASPTVVPTATPSATVAPTATPTPTAIPVANNNYNVTIEKRVDGTRVDGDKVGIQYRVKIKNNSNENFNNFEVRDTLPADFTYDQNTTEGDIKVNPEIQDVSGDDNRRLVWKVATLEKGKEINFGYRTTGKKEDKNYCNDAKIEKDGNVVSTSQACVRVNQSSTQVLGASTDKTLPSTGATQTIAVGLLMLGLAGVGLKLSKHIE